MKKCPSKADWYRIYAAGEGWADPDAKIPDLSELEVKPNADGSWMIYMDGELLCVVASKRSALAVQRIIVELGRRLVMAKERADALADSIALAR